MCASFLADVIYCSYSQDVKADVALNGVGIRLWSETGRMWGHLKRGRLHFDIMRRFNWFCDFMDVVRFEQFLAVKQWILRIFVFVTML